MVKHDIDIDIDLDPNEPRSPRARHHPDPPGEHQAQTRSGDPKGIGPMAAGARRSGQQGGARKAAYERFSMGRVWGIHELSRLSSLDKS